MAMETLIYRPHHGAMTTTEHPTPDTSGEPRPVLVTAATGKTGSRVVAALTEAGVAVRPASRTSSTAFDWAAPDSWAPALKGARATYLVPPEEPVDLDRFVAEAATAGLERIVLLSARHPEQGGDGLVPSFEEAVRQGPVPATILQPSWFTQNFTEGMFTDELAGGVLRLPVGDGQEPFIDTADIAAVAVAALTGDGHEGVTHELSGPELLSFGEAIQRLARATGRDVRFEDVAPDAWAESASAFLPPEVVTLLSNLFTAIREGDNAHLSPGVAAVLGRDARTVDQALAPSS